MDRDFRLINRIVDRIEQSEGFSYNKQYNLIMFGEVQNKTTKDFMHNLFPYFYLKPVLAYNMPKDIFANKDFIAT